MAVCVGEKDDERENRRRMNVPSKTAELEEGDRCAMCGVLRARLDPARGRSYRTVRTCDAGNCDMPTAGRASVAGLNVRTAVLGWGV